MAEQDNLLSSEEMAALVSDPKEGLDAGGLGFQGERKAQKYDIASESAALNFNLDAVHRINQKLGKSLQQGLESALKSTIEVAPQSVDLVSFGDYLNQSDTITASNIVSVEPLRGRALVVIDMPVLLSALSNFFGGTVLNGKARNANRQFTPTEITVKDMILNVTLDSMREAWTPILPLKPSFIGLETILADAKITSPLHSVFINKFSIIIGGTPSGSIDIVYPYSMLRPISSKLTQWAQGSVKKESLQSSWRSRLNMAVTNAKVEIRVELGQIHLTLEELEMLGSQEVVMFNKPPLAAASVDGITIFEGSVGTQSSQMAVQVVRPLRAK
tara:strand:+ start:1815 stop:2804 length:990 start_codon:yes stop_codon:yes gene_type:complete